MQTGCYKFLDPNYEALFYSSLHCNLLFHRMDFIKSNHNKTPFPIISFFDSVGVNDEQEAKKLFIDFVQEILNFDKKALSSESFTQKSRNDGYKVKEVTKYSCGSRNFDIFYIGVGRSKC